MGRRYESLRQVTTDDLAAQLAPLPGATRLLALSAMRSLFATLKARRVLFTNPAAPLTGHTIQPPPVLPLDDCLRARLLGRLHNPAERLIVLLAGVHALRPAEICALTLDAADPAASTLLTGGRARPLDQLTTSHLRAWLQARHARWPATANPHLLINRSTAGGLDPVSRSYIHAAVRRAGITAPTCVPTGSMTKPTPPAATRSGLPACSGSATRPLSATPPNRPPIATVHAAAQDPRPSGHGCQPCQCRGEPMDEDVIPILRVANAATAVSWYERLGLSKDWEHRFEPGMPAFVSIARGRARLFLSEHRGDARPDTLVQLFVKDIDAVVAEFGLPKTSRPMGARSSSATPTATGCGSHAGNQILPGPAAPAAPGTLRPAGRRQ